MRMKESTVFRIARGANPGLLVLGILCITLLATAPAADAAELPGLTVMGVAPDGTETTLTDYRWLVEEDQTYHVPVYPEGHELAGTAIGGIDGFDPNWQQGHDGLVGGETLSVSFHDSYMPVVAKGCNGDAAWQTAAACSDVPFVAEGTKNYYVSVVPRSGYSIGGAVYDPNGTVVYVHQYPIQTAQISILIFQDNNSINGAPDLPREDPALDADGDGFPDNPMDGFQIIVEDAGGRYGASAGVQSQDAFGNPLGTTYDATGNVNGFEPLITGPDGRLTIKNLAPGKYGIQAIPPAGQNWVQTSTIEGTKIIDAWVKANEPPFFAEFGPAGFHVFIGFIQPFSDVAGGTATLSGKIVNNHMSRPPDYAFYNGACFGHTTPWVGLNEVTGGLPGRALYAASTVGECDFTIPDVPAGDYQLVVWDTAMDLIIAFKGVSIDAAGNCNTLDGLCNFVEVPVFQWFHRQEHRVFNDTNHNGVWDLGETLSDDEVPINDQGLGLRWRDGTVYQGNVTDFTGAYTFDQVFPFFSWLVAEVDFVRFEATGLTSVVDNGGPIPASSIGPGGTDLTFDRAIAPQDQTNPREGAGLLCEDGLTSCTADTDCAGIGAGTCSNTSFCEANPDICIETETYRTELGPVLTAGFQGFIGQTSAYLWGKGHYLDIAPGLAGNGGISGIVFYAVTRAENDPAAAAAEPWEPGIPGVTVNLYSETGTLLNSTTTDSWDDSIPTGCKWGNGATDTFRFSPDGVNFFEQDCYDGLRAFNQIRPAVFDGGYAFDDVCAATGGLNQDGTCPDNNPADGFEDWQGFIAPGNFIVEIVPPPGYEILKPQDKNVDFGDEYEEEPTLFAKAALPVVPQCVGADTLIPPYLTLFPDQQIPSPFAWQDTNGDGIDEYVPTSRPLCDRKEVILTAGANAAADFWLFTEVPVAAHANGFILDDTQNEFDPNSPNFGEKYAPPFVPVTIRDWSGRIISKTLSDQYGTYNFIGPSTITTNLPAPSGMSPNMLTTCMNDPGDDPNNPDPNWNQQYSTFCYNFQYMPGVTTYLDTPVVPVAAFTGPDQFPLDCEFSDGTPRIWEVRGDNIGPYVAAATGTETITITSMGTREVQNPNYCNVAAGACPTGAETTNKFVSRDYGFGADAGQVYVGDLEIPAGNVTWDSASITAILPAGTTTGQLRVVRGDNGAESVTAVTVQVGLRQNADVAYVTPSGGATAHDIQDAIDLAGANDLILVGCGTANEMVVMWKPVQLQGSGECTTINAVKAPTDKLDVWRGLVDGLIGGGSVDLLPGQEVGPGAPEPTTLWNEEGAGILVLAKAGGPNRFERDRNRDARIDGFTIRGADTGGGIIANGYADYLQISNNRIANNSGFYGGGIRVGHPTLTAEQPDGGFDYTDGDNDYVSIHHNQVVFNGGQGGVGGGISMCTGADSYRITENWVCGNFSLGEGGGIGHTGRSDGSWVTVPTTGPQNQRVWTLTDIPLIADNKVIFNENFFQGSTISGGGIFIGGAPALPLAPGGLTPGAGNVQVIGNLIQGNSAGAGDGGGIRLAGVNGRDVADNPDNDPRRNGNQGRNDPNPWYAVDVFNNMLVNNVAALAGGGISMRDAVDVRLVHNTIANNDSMATAGEAFAPNSPNQSTPQDGAGIASRVHSAQLTVASGNVGTFSDPSAFADNIIWQNRQFFFFVDDTTGCTPGDPSCTSTYGVCPDVTGDLNCPAGGGLGFDLAVLGTAGTLACDPGASCILTGGSDPEFVLEYLNGSRSAALQPEQTTGIQTPAAFDEGGNFIRVKFGPLSLNVDFDAVEAGVNPPDYHIQSGSPAVDNAGAVDLTGTYPDLATDYDGEGRPDPTSGLVDIGADEVQQ